MNLPRMLRESESIRTGRPIYESNPSGKIHPVDPAAVDRLKAHFADLDRDQSNESKPTKNDIIGNLMRTQNSRQVELNDRRRLPEIPAQKLRHWHINYYQAGLSLSQVSQEVGVQRNRLAKLFKKHGLPVARNIEDRHWLPPQGGDS